MWEPADMFKGQTINIVERKGYAFANIGRVALIFEQI